MYHLFSLPGKDNGRGLPRHADSQPPFFWYPFPASTLSRSYIKKKKKEKRFGRDSSGIQGYIRRNTYSQISRSLLKDDHHIQEISVKGKDIFEFYLGKVIFKISENTNEKEFIFYEDSLLEIGNLIF